MDRADRRNGDGRGPNIPDRKGGGCTGLRAGIQVALRCENAGRRSQRGCLHHGILHALQWPELAEPRHHREPDEGTQSSSPSWRKCAQRRPGRQQDAVQAPLTMKKIVRDPNVKPSPTGEKLLAVFPKY